jgi:hypothetical protein
LVTGAKIVGNNHAASAIEEVDERRSLNKGKRGAGAEDAQNAVGVDAVDNAQRADYRHYFKLSGLSMNLDSGTLKHFSEPGAAIAWIIVWVVEREREAVNDPRASNTEN